MSYLEGVIEMSGRKLPSHMDIVQTANIITISSSGSNGQVYIASQSYMCLYSLHFLKNVTCLIELVFVKKLNFKLETDVKLVNNLVCCPFLTRQNSDAGISVIPVLLCPLCFDRAPVRT